MAEAGEARKRQCVACSKQVWTVDSICRYCGTPTFFRTAAPPTKADRDAYERNAEEDPESGLKYDRKFPIRGWNWGPLVCNWNWLFAHKQPVWGGLMLLLHLPVYALAAFFVVRGWVFPNDFYGRLYDFYDGIKVYIWGTALLSILGLPFCVCANQIAWKSGKYAAPHEIKWFQGDYIKNWAGGMALASIVAMPLIYKGMAVMENKQAMEKAQYGAGYAMPQSAPRGVWRHFGYGYDTKQRVVIENIQCPDCSGSGKSPKKNLLGNFTDCPTCRGTGSAPVTIPLGDGITSLNLKIEDPYTMERERGQP